MAVETVYRDILCVTQGRDIFDVHEHDEENVVLKTGSICQVFSSLSFVCCCVCV